MPPGTVVGRYVILHVLGQGGAGLVYAAYDGELDRKLALKFLRVRGDDAAATEAARRLKREAQAMAKLSHPNVVSIHDVGHAVTHGSSDMFLVMDLVAGGTLRQWLAGSHSWKERLTLLCKAGDGLAAAHAAGIVHRDFKPANVLVDGDEPRVTDFGVAAAEHGVTSSPASPAAPLGTSIVPISIPPPAVRDTLRHSDGLVGTIGYLAPEQALLEPVDARSDQFAFCVTLHQALYGVLPFPTDDLLTYVDAVREARVRSAPSSSVPRAVHAAIMRGLSARPADRFASMEVLLTELRRDRDRDVRLRAGGVATLAIVGVLVFFTARAAHVRPPLCAAPDDELGGTWTPTLRNRIADVFARTSTFDGKAFGPLASQIDRYAHGIAEMRTQSCVATRVRGEQPDTVMTLRTQCLDGRARELAALVRMLAEGDGHLVDGAVESLSKLSSVDDCADIASLTAPIPPPTSDVATAVAKVREELSEIHALSSAGRFAVASARAADAV
ncbi:MAG: serine/threonine-protein kinase, partial [Polyangiales bacterium]